MDLLIPLSRKEDLDVFHYKNIEEKIPRYFREIYWHTVRVHTDEDSFQDITDAMMEKLREEGELRDSIELRKEGELRDSIQF